MDSIAYLVGSESSHIDKCKPRRIKSSFYCIRTEARSSQKQLLGVSNRSWKWWLLNAAGWESVGDSHHSAVLWFDTPFPIFPKRVIIKAQWQKTSGYNIDFIRRKKYQRMSCFWEVGGGGMRRFLKLLAHLELKHQQKESWTSWREWETTSYI